MRDSDIRAAVRQKLWSLHSGDPFTCIVEEMGIWSGSARIDIAVINGELSGFELKSARDTLERLSGQAGLYNEVFDRVTLVAASRHAERVIQSEVVPDWWGVVVAQEVGEGQLSLSDLRRARRNPAINPIQVARLLWRAEALSLLERYRLDEGVRTKPAEVLARRLADQLPLPELCHEVRSALKSRVNWLRQPVAHQ